MLINESLMCVYIYIYIYIYVYHIHTKQGQGEKSIGINFSSYTSEGKPITLSEKTDILLKIRA